MNLRCLSAGLLAAGVIFLSVGCGAKEDETSTTPDTSAPAASASNSGAGGANSMQSRMGSGAADGAGAAGAAKAVNDPSISPQGQKYLQERMPSGGGPPR